MKRALLGLALAALLPVSAQAADEAAAGISYSYIEAGYTNADWADGNFDGFTATGSFGFAEHWYGSASYRQVDENDVDVGLDHTTINLGWHTRLADTADFLAEIGYVNLGVDVLGFDESSDGWRAAAGVRGMLAPKFEARGMVSYTDINELDGGEFGVTVGATWHFNQTWGLTGSYEHTQLVDEDMDIWGLGVRASF